MVAPALLLGGAALSGGLNAWGAHSANKAQASYIAKALKAYKSLLAEQSVSGKQALGAQQSALDAIKSGFASALGETSRLGDAGELAARQYGQQQLGQAEQSLIDRNMYNPEQVGYWSRGIGSDVLNLIMQNNERTAQARAGLMTDAGLATAGAYGNIAGQISSNFGQRAGLAENMIGIGANRQPYSADYGDSLGWLAAAMSQMGAKPSGGLTFFNNKAQSAASPNPYQTFPFMR